MAEVADEDNDQIDPYELKLVSGQVTALPQIQSRFKPIKPLPGISYLAMSGFYDEMNRNKQRRNNMTRRNITEHKISNNILTEKEQNTLKRNQESLGKQIQNSQYVQKTQKKSLKY